MVNVVPNMKAAITMFAILSSAALVELPGQRLSAQDGAHKNSAPKSKSSQQSLTGCVDEQDGNYVLLDDKMLNRLADLEAVGASNEAFFAKHLGHKVTVKGTKSSESDARFKVTSIEDLSAVCAPAQPNTQ
jgi:hypothetical protein